MGNKSGKLFFQILNVCDSEQLFRTKCFLLGHNSRLKNKRLLVSTKKLLFMKIIQSAKFLLLLLTVMSIGIDEQLMSQNPKLYFTHDKNFNFSKVETFDSFSAGDTIFGLLLVPNKPAYSYQLSLTSYAIVENNETVIPIKLSIAGQNEVVEYNVALASGLSPKKNRDF